MTTILRRTAERSPAAAQLALGDCTFDPARGELFRDGVRVFCVAPGM